MNPNEQTLANFQTRVRQMILRFQELKKESNELRTIIAKNEQDMKDLRSKLTQAENDYMSLKTAKMMEITDGDLESAKARLARMIRDVNKCIAILSDEEQSRCYTMAEVNNEKLHIRLHVYDEEIEMTVKRSDEEYFRRAAKLITDRYNAYAQAYKGKKGEHTIALMTLIDVALMYERERGKNDTAPYQDILAKLTSEIEEALESENILTI